MTTFYTRKGDDGYTGLLSEGRVPKYHPIPETVGVLDEANASLGLARSTCKSERNQQLLLTIQRDLYAIMAEISASPNHAERFRKIDEDRVAWLEKQTDDISLEVEIPREFIVPGDSPAGAALALARTIVRRAERRIAELVHDSIVENKMLLHYLNRLSSLCFILELYENQLFGKGHLTLAKE
jgi:cob(I)alamin adenosyltransferase